MADDTAAVKTAIQQTIVIDALLDELRRLNASQRVEWGIAQGHIAAVRIALEHHLAKSVSPPDTDDPGELRAHLVDGGDLPGEESVFCACGQPAQTWCYECGVDLCIDCAEAHLNAVPGCGDDE